MEFMIAGLWLYWGWIMGVAVSYRDTKGIIAMLVVGALMVGFTIWTFSVW